MKKFNTRRRLKGFILSAVSSSKWVRPIVSPKFGLENRQAIGDDDDDDEFLSEQTRNKLFLEDQTSSIGNSNFFNRYSKFSAIFTSLSLLSSTTAISAILDSLEDLQYLTDYFETECTFIDEICENSRLQSLLEVESNFDFIWFNIDLKSIEYFIIK